MDREAQRARARGKRGHLEVDRSAPYSCGQRGTFRGVNGPGLVVVAGTRLATEKAPVEGTRLVARNLLAARRHPLSDAMARKLRLKARMRPLASAWRS